MTARAQGPPIVFEWQRAVRDDPTLHSTTRLVAFVASTYANTDGTQVRPGVARLAQGAGLGERATRDHMTALEVAGYLERVERGGRHGQVARAAHYRLRVPTGSVVPVERIRPTGAVAPDGTSACGIPNRHLTTPQPAPDDIPTGTPAPPTDSGTYLMTDTTPSASPSTAVGGPDINPGFGLDDPVFWAEQEVERITGRPLGSVAGGVLADRIGERGDDPRAVVAVVVRMIETGVAP